MNRSASSRRTKTAIESPSGLMGDSETSTTAWTSTGEGRRRGQEVSRGPEETDQVQQPRFRLFSKAAALAALATLVITPALDATSTVLPRSVSDRPDERSGPQIHVMYVVPSDGADRALDTDGTIAASVKNWQTWLHGQTAGHGLFLDAYQGELDVTFDRLPRTDAQYASRGVFIRDAIESDLRAAGFSAPGKIYLAYYDGSSTAACGGGAWPPALVGNVAAIYMRATYGQGSLCYTPSLSLNGLQIMDFAALHEVMHTMGFVPTCAPHQTRAGHVSDSPTDLMYAGDQPWYPSVLDFGRDDYFDAHIPGCLDLANSPYFGATQSPAPPPSGKPSANYRLTVKVVGPGRVLSAPAGIACPRRCAAAFSKGTKVTLRPRSVKRSRFVRWSGACSGSKRCTVVLSRPRSVSARFREPAGGSM